MTALSCGLGGSGGGIVEVGESQENVDVPSDPITVPGIGRDCESDDPEIGCRSNQAPAGTVFDFIESDLLVTYVSSGVLVEPNQDYGSPLAVSFSATFDVENNGDEAFEVSNFVRESVVFDIADRNPDLGWETSDGYSSRGYPVEGLWIEPGVTMQVTATYAIATRGWDVVEPWAIGLREPDGFTGPSLRASPIDFGAASDSYAQGGVGASTSASSDSPQAVVDAFHEAITAWDVEAMCAQMTSQAHVHFTGRLVAGDCPGVVRDIMGFDWQTDVQSRFEQVEIVEFWTGDEAIPAAETIMRNEFNEDGVYAVVEPSAGPWDLIVYDFASDEGGIRIDVFYPIRRL